MTKIYDALKRAEKMHGAQDGFGAQLRTEAGTGRAQSLRQRLVAVYQSIECSLPGMTSRTVVFAAARRGEGVSTLAREVGALASGEFAQKVALIDMTQGAGRHHERFGLTPDAGLDAMLAGDRRIDEVLQEADGSGLFLGCLTTGRVSSSTIVADPRFAGLVTRLHEHFGLVLFDAPSLSESSDALVVAPHTDGVIFVVESGKTRWQVAASACERLSTHGGKILGVILTRRQFHIPRFIYKLL